MEIAIPLYDRFTALDAVGPYEVLWRLPGARVRWVGAEARPYATDRGLQLVAEATFDDHGDSSGHDGDDDDDRSGSNTGPEDHGGDDDNGGGDDDRSGSNSGSN